MTYGGQGESLVPPYTRGSVSFSRGPGRNPGASLYTWKCLSLPASYDVARIILLGPKVRLDLLGCPCADDSDEYKAAVFDMFPSLMYLDGLDLDGNERIIDDDEDDEAGPVPATSANAF